MNWKGNGDRSYPAESIGSGFYKMINGWKSYYKTKPEITGDFDYYKIVFKFTPSKTEMVSGGVNAPVNAPANAAEKRLEMIIEQMKINDRITLVQLAEIYKVDVTTIRRNILKLKIAGRIRRIGPDKNGRWEVTK